MGTANIARGVLIPAIQQSTFGTVEAIGSRDLEKARSVAQSLGIARAVGSYEALLDDPNIDAVYIPLPNALHAEWTIRAAEAGKAVLCDKPLATSAQDAARQIEACSKAWREPHGGFHVSLPSPDAACAAAYCVRRNRTGSRSPRPSVRQHPADIRCVEYPLSSEPWWWLSLRHGLLYSKYFTDGLRLRARASGRQNATSIPDWVSMLATLASSSLLKASP